MNRIFEKYNHKKSRDNARDWLLEYWDWRDEAKRKEITVGSPSYDGQPKAKSFAPDEGLIDWANAQSEWKRREKVLDYIASKGDEHEIYALILDDRFVHHHRSVTAVRMKLGLSERTFYDYQDNALYEAARIIPAKGILVEN